MLPITTAFLRKDLDRPTALAAVEDAEVAGRVARLEPMLAIKG